MLVVYWLSFREFHGRLQSIFLLVCTTGNQRGSFTRSTLLSQQLPSFSPHNAVVEDADYFNSQEWKTVSLLSLLQMFRKATCLDEIRTHTCMSQHCDRRAKSEAATI